MPKKKLNINPRAIARSVRISERHRQSKSKVSEENAGAGQTNENGLNSKCKLRDIKNNKKKNDKKELSRLMFAKVVPENLKENIPPTPIKQENNAASTSNKCITPPKRIINKPKNEENTIGPNQNGAKTDPVQNENTQNTSNKSPKLTSYRETIFINYPNILGREVEENVDQALNNMIYQDFLNSSPDTSYFKYIVNNKPVMGNTNGFIQGNQENKAPIVYPNIADDQQTRAVLNENIIRSIQILEASPSGNESDLVENDECVKIMASLCGYASEEEKESALERNAELWKNNIFNPDEKIIMKYISEQFFKLAETSDYLKQTQENLKHIIKYQETKEVKEMNDEKVEEVLIEGENGSFYKINEIDIGCKVEEVKVKEEELVLLEVEVKNKLFEYVKNLPKQLKTKLCAAVESSSNPIRNDSKNEVSQTDAQQSQQTLQNGEQEEANGLVVSTEFLKIRNYKGPCKLSQRQKRNKKKRFARTRRRRNNATSSAKETNKIEEMRDASNATFDLPEHNANETFEINFVEPEDANKKNADVSHSTPADDLNSFEQVITNSYEALDNILNRINQNQSGNENNFNILEETEEMTLTPDETSFLVRVINDRNNFKEEQRENYIKKYFALTENPKSLFKANKCGFQNQKKIVLNFIHMNFTFVGDEEDDESSGTDFPENESDLHDESPVPNEVKENYLEVNEVIPIIRKVDPAVQERMNQYENIYIDINIAAMNQLIPRDPLNEKQYEEYDKNRLELYKKFTDLFEMNHIKI